ncbi:ribosome maturation factor RimM [Frondihabitans peucedani]|uniref:Ribosome maturation factor RimM n=1 Tax=Frondihabitans peucedani TaxID=598626 RepID=A0ABP8DZA2_9MICO
MSDTAQTPADSPEQGTTRLRVGRLTKAHGLKGALKLELFTDAPEKRFVPGAVFSLQVPTESAWHGKTIELAELRWYNSHPVGFFRGIDDRTAAETLVKAILWVEHEGVEVSDEPDAWFDHQLVGLSVVRDGVEVGTISRLDHLPAQDLLAVDTPSGEVLVPFVSAIVPSVDLDAGVVTVTPPMGLFEEIPEDDDDASETADSGASETADSGADDDDADARETEGEQDPADPAPTPEP